MRNNVAAIPLYERALLRKLRIRSIVLSIHTSTEGFFVNDDDTFDHGKRSNFGLVALSVRSDSIRHSVTVEIGWTSKVDNMKGECVVVPSTPAAVLNGAPIEFEDDSVVRVLVLRKPGVSALVKWEIGSHKPLTQSKVSTRLLRS